MNRRMTQAAIAKGAMCHFSQISFTEGEVGCRAIVTLIFHSGICGVRIWQVRGQLDGRGVETPFTREPDIPDEQLLGLSAGRDVTVPGPKVRIVGKRR